jgi:hypothetical protein
MFSKPLISDLRLSLLSASLLFPFSFVFISMRFRLSNNAVERKAENASKKVQGRNKRRSNRKLVVSGRR